jgi:hypothetical protein
MAGFLVDLGTGIWRIRRKIEGLSRMPREIRDALYSLESMWMSMSEGGVEIVDHIGTMPAEREAVVGEVRDMPGLTREQVIDAVKPTILLRGEVVQTGEVVVGRPASPSGVSVSHPPESREPEPETPAEAVFESPEPAEEPAAEDPVAVETQQSDDDDAPPEHYESETPDISAPPVADGLPEIKTDTPDEPPETMSEDPAAMPDSEEAETGIPEEEPRYEESPEAVPESLPEAGETGVVSEVPAETEEAEIIPENLREPEALSEQPVPEGEVFPEAAGEAVTEETREEPAPKRRGRPPKTPNKSKPSAEDEEAAMQIPLPPKAARKGRTVREALKQAILEEPEASAFDDAGRTRRRKSRAAAAKAENAETPETKAPRARRAPKKTSEGDA